jgi:hypothetical protein
MHREQPMERLSGISGYFASTLVLFTFFSKDMRLLRTTAIFSNVDARQTEASDEGDELSPPHSAPSCTP